MRRVDPIMEKRADEGLPPQTIKIRIANDNGAGKTSNAGNGGGTSNRGNGNNAASLPSITTIKQKPSDRMAPEGSNQEVTNSPPSVTTIKQRPSDRVPAGNSNNAITNTAPNATYASLPGTPDDPCLSVDPLTGHCLLTKFQAAARQQEVVQSGGARSGGSAFGDTSAPGATSPSRGGTTYVTPAQMGTETAAGRELGNPIDSDRPRPSRTPWWKGDEDCGCPMNGPH